MFMRPKGCSNMLHCWSLSLLMRQALPRLYFSISGRLTIHATARGWFNVHITLPSASVLPAPPG